MDSELVDAYLRRIGAERPERADAAALRYLQERHVLSVPFENLAFHLNEPVPQSVEAVRKIVYEGRGGCCFELNTAFALLLQTLGFRVSLLGGHIYRGKEISSPFGHLALRVEVDEPRAGGGSSWLVDVGQGSHSRWPLDFALRTPQEDPHGAYLLTETPEGDIDVACDGVPLYRMEIRPRDAEFSTPVIWWYRTAPDSPFVRRIMCVQPREDGKVVLTGQLLIRDQNGHQTRERILAEEDLREAYRTWFGIHLERLPELPERPVARAS
ncbi:arylamine N-acetyltransferase [Streptomyces sp. NPDC047042]|uniref:arylamine N-acetyltransferase family protein n=1 Tax=Streptomyces sp. NPDC047042 TaxID=3154807 RepID=UPI0033D429B7